MLQVTDSPKQPAWRRGRPTPPGPVHLVNFATIDRRPHFAQFAHAAGAAKALHEAQQAGTSRLLAWVLLPESWYGLIELGPGDALARSVARYKFAMARALREADPLRERVWSPTFQDRHVLSDKEILDAASWLVQHPLRRGLADRLTDYPFWDAVWLPPLAAAPRPPAPPPRAAAPPDVAVPAPVPALMTHPALCF